MAHLQVVEAVEAKLKAGFTGCPIFLENSFQGTPNAADAWLLLDFPFSDARQASIGSPGSNRYRETGAFRVVLSVPAGDGAHQGRVWLDQIAALFRGQFFEGVRTYAPTSAASDDRNDVGAYFRLSIAVPYDFSLIG